MCIGQIFPFLLLIIGMKEQYNIKNEEEIMGISFCKSSKNKLQYETRSQYSYSDENHISMKYTKNKYCQDRLKKKPFGDKGEGYAFAPKQKDSSPTQHMQTISHSRARTSNRSTKQKR